MELHLVWYARKSPHDLFHSHSQSQYFPCGYNRNLPAAPTHNTVSVHKEIYVHQSGNHPAPLFEYVIVCPILSLFLLSHEFFIFFCFVVLFHKINELWNSKKSPRNCIPSCHICSGRLSIFWMEFIYHILSLLLIYELLPNPVSLPNQSAHMEVLSARNGLNNNTLLR